MFDFVNQPLRLKYYHPAMHFVIDAGPVQFEEPWYDAWVDSMVRMDENSIFFIVIESTDVFEKKFDFNEVPMSFIGASAIEHARATGHKVTNLYGEPGWRCLDCEDRAPGWRLIEKLVKPTKPEGDDPRAGHEIPPLL
jgi:hypothetical protein